MNAILMAIGPSDYYPAVLRQDSDTFGHKMLAGAVDSALLRSKPPSGVALSGRQSPSKSLEHPVLNIYYYCVPGVT